MNRARQFFFVFCLLALLLLIFTRPASAFDGRSDDNNVITSEK